MIDLSGYCILVIDDDEASIYLLEKLCALYKIRTLSYTSPATALDAIFTGLAESPGAVFLDLNLKVTSGYRLQDALRKHLTCPIVAYTSAVHEMVSVKLAGFDGFISKPPDTRIFEKQVEDILIHKKAVWSITQAYSG